LPAVFDRMGDVTYRGKLTGTYHHFAADGILETALGTAETAVDLSIRNGGNYAGTIASAEFDLGTLFQHPQLAYSGFDIRIAGNGFSMHDVSTHVDGEVSYLDLKGYRYTDINLTGQFSEMQFAGHVAVHDPNLQLDFDGGINFNPDQPEYAFDASISYANLD